MNQKKKLKKVGYHWSVLQKRQPKSILGGAKASMGILLDLTPAGR